MGPHTSRAKRYRRIRKSTTQLTAQNPGSRIVSAALPACDVDATPAPPSSECLARKKQYRLKTCRAAHGVDKLRNTSTRTDRSSIACSPRPKASRMHCAAIEESPRLRVIPRWLQEEQGTAPNFQRWRESGFRVEALRKRSRIPLAVSATRRRATRFSWKRASRSVLA